ncbi:MAG: DUF5010 domain-containing protein [Anaerolineales bacterium]|jgi:hypothetical protein|nr:DUF5010 domain-containing protein [Anaerolineales bacterium]
MKKKLAGFLVIIATLFFLLPSDSGGQSAPQTWTPDDKLVATYYFYWYDIYTGSHLIAPDGSDFITNHPPDSYLADYSYSEVSWHRRQLLDMMTAQIDIVLPVYFGSEVNFYWSKPGVTNLVTAMQDLIKEGYIPPKIGMFFDTNALQEQNNNVPPDLTTLEGKALFYQMIFDFFELVPNDLWATLNDRPILFLYTSTFASAYDQSTFDYLNQHFQSDFGTTPYLVLNNSWQGVSTDETYTWGSALFGPMMNGRVGTLGPGFDDTNNYYITTPRIRDRECGEFYNSGWEAMMSAGSTLVVIETWNELHEATEIAASREYSTTYISLTAENVLQWKATDYSTAEFIWLDFGARPYQQGLQSAFNFPDGAWLVTTLAGREAVYPDATTTPTSNYIYLDVNNAFAHATPGEVWVTVEYFDGGTDQWALNYDSISDPYTWTEAVTLQNTGQWKRHTFHLTDAYFGGREAGGADLRLSDTYWADGQTNYFGRIWISKSAPDNQAPDLAELDDEEMLVGQEIEIPVSTTDPDGDSILLTLDRNIAFNKLIDNGDGTGILRLAPTLSDARRCPYPIRIISTDTGSPALADSISLQVTIVTRDVFLPLLRR